MRKKRPLFLRYFVLLLCIAMSGALLLYTSQSVQRAESELSEVRQSVQREAQMIEVLGAEWAKLNSPYNLENLTQRYLKLVPPDTSYIAPEMPELPEAESISLPEILEQEQDLKVHAAAGGVIRPAKKPAVKPDMSLKPADREGLHDLMQRLKEGGQ